MARPNKTVAAWRNAKWSQQALEVRPNSWEAQDAADAMRSANPSWRVVIRSFRVGPRSEQRRNYAIRGYITD